MNADNYQALAVETMQFDKSGNEALSIVILGLNGEVGSLSTEYKKNYGMVKVIQFSKIKSLKNLVILFGTLQPLQQ